MRTVFVVLIIIAYIWFWARMAIGEEYKKLPLKEKFLSPLYLIIIFLLKSAVIVGVVYLGYIGIKYIFQTKGDQVRSSRFTENSSLVEKAISIGDYREANFILAKMNSDLKKIHNESIVIQLDSSYQEVKMIFDQTVRQTQVLFNSLGETLYSLDHQRAEELLSLVDTENINPRDNILINTLKEYIYRVSKGDYLRAEDAFLLAKYFSAGYIDLIPFEENLLNLARTSKFTNFRIKKNLEEKFREIISLANNSIKNRKRPVIKGSVLTWNFTDGSNEIHEFLLEKIKHPLENEKITIFCILEQSWDLIGSYTISRTEGYREEMVIGIVYWPDYFSYGTITLYGGMPPSEISYVPLSSSRQSPRYGSQIKLNEWIESLPKVK